MTWPRILLFCLAMVLGVLSNDTRADADASVRTDAPRRAVFAAAPTFVEEDAAVTCRIPRTRVRIAGVHPVDRRRRAGPPAAAPGQMIVNPFVGQPTPARSSPVSPKPRAPAKDVVKPRTIFNPYCVREDKLAAVGTGAEDTRCTRGVTEKIDLTDRETSFASPLIHLAQVTTMTT